MKELVYKNIDGENPRKKEVSIEESDSRFRTCVVKKWICKYFIKSRHETRSARELEQWIAKARIDSRKKRKCHILKQIDARLGETKIVCKVLGEFYAVRGLTAFKIMYVNVLKIRMASKNKER